jgi:uncharacterized membrane protein (UPF0127 family)
MQRISLQFDAGRGCHRLELMVATGVVERMRGLLGHAPLGQSEGMLLPACGMIHTFGMRYPIDVVYLDGQGTVVKVTPALVARRMGGHWRARAVLELAAGTAGRCGIHPGVALGLAAGMLT